jgi:hypothetical protein
MFYWVWLKDRRGKPFIYEDSLLPGIIPAHQIGTHLVSSFKNSGFVGHATGPWLT